MRKRKTLKKGEESEGSEPEAEPDEFQDSGEDWTPDADSNEQPARGGRKRASKASLNNSKKKRKEESEEDSDVEGEEEEVDEEDLDEEDGSDDDKNGSDANKSDSSQSKDVPKQFHSGNFVLLKSDVKWNGDEVTSKLDELNLWKIDGKALLQKFIPMESNGKILHKCTCVYSGWNVDNRDNYYPITEILDRNPKTDSKEICVALDLNDLIKDGNAPDTLLEYQMCMGGGSHLTTSEPSARFPSYYIKKNTQEFHIMTSCMGGLNITIMGGTDSLPKSVKIMVTGTYMRNYGNDTQKLVLRKEGRPADSPSAYRPIVLLDEAGKLL